MLALNSYGLAPRASGSSNNAAPERVTLPRLCGAGLPAAREIRSLGKLDILARRPGHPLFRTTTGYDYGRYLDFQDVALSCPKYARPAAFTKEFIAGNYADSSLLSLENSRRRSENWQQKMAVRTSRMRVKYAELQHVLEEKRELRRIERDRRRHEMELLRSAVVQLQARLRGFLTRRTISQEKLKRDTEAALCIQQASRARARVRVAKKVLEARRREKQEVFVVKIQRVCRSFLQHKRAKRQLISLREAKRQRLSTSSTRLCVNALVQPSRSSGWCEGTLLGRTSIASLLVPPAQRRTKMTRMRCSRSTGGFAVAVRAGLSLRCNKCGASTPRPPHVSLLYRLNSAVSKLPI